MRFKCLSFLTIFVMLLISFLEGTPASQAASLWAPLTPFEIQTLNDIEAARSGDADTLLAFALIASGDVRHQHTFDSIQQQVHQFIQRIRPTIESQSSIYGKGQKLLRAMHDRYFTKYRKDATTELIDGYDSEQSNVSAIFKRGQFNCVSSAILYMVLARYFYLDVQGIATMHHAFVQIIVSNHRPIEVETTSKNGYGQVHDKTFYETGFAAFSLTRNLAVPTYEDYLNRQVLSPLMLIAKNMNNQHTLASRMDKTARHRLFEIRGYLDKDTAAAQVNRLGVYQNSLIALFKARRHSKAEELTQIIAPVLDRIKTRSWIRETQNNDVLTIWERLGAIHTVWGHLLFANKDYDRAEHHYEEALQWGRTAQRQAEANRGIHKTRAFRAFEHQAWGQAIAAYQHLLSLMTSSDIKLASQIRENIAAAYWNWGNAAGEQSDWMTAAAHYGTINKWSVKKDTLKKAKVAHARANAMHHFNAARWAKAIQYFNEVITIEGPEHGATNHRNIASAFINWGNALFYDQDYGSALQKYELALNVVEIEKKSIVHLNAMAVYYALTAPLLKENRITEAITIMKASVKRFPDCTTCQHEIIRLKELAAAQRKK